MARLKKAARMVQNPAVSHYGSPQAPSADSYELAAAPQPRPVLRPQATTTQHKIANLHIAPVRSTQPQPDMFEQALARATSHEQKFDDRKIARRKGGHVAVLLTIMTCLLLVAGLLAYINVPSISMHMASAHAGFQAKLPGYNPVGYSFGNLSYGPGNVTVSYKSDDTHKFDITQRESNWDSDALLSNFVASANKAYQTYERAGRTIYFFGNNTATWVDNGIWYTVNGNNSLSRSQMLDLAGSI
jgi:hypothetical protein